ncbi:3-isopropylmalate dehydratase small subunit [Actinoplanes sp. NPDC049548]|uniref:3-isopropylmalate dehydratase small subunit n=1 Tax=Actinoplanes sp. NPDC049548 TaxID=3155152 RepID=UPI00343726CE
MEPLTRHRGRALALRRSDVDTDQIIPAEFCKRLTKSGYEDALFAHWRKEPDFVLNRPDAAGASVLVAGHNFGTGSSREHAVWALRDWGFAAVIATSFGDIFLRNALKNGLLAVRLDAEAVTYLAERAEPGDLTIDVDLVDCAVRADERSWPFEVDSRARWLLLNGLDDIAVTIDRDERIAAYERRRPSFLPTIERGSLALGPYVQPGATR